MPVESKPGNSIINKRRVSEGKDDDEGVHPKHRKEPNVNNVGHCFLLKPTVNNRGGSVNWKLAREGTPGCYSEFERLI